MVNTNALKGAIVAAGHSQRSLAKLLCMSENTLGSKVNNKLEFTAEEIIRLCEKINIHDAQTKVDIFLPSSSHFREIDTQRSTT